MRGTWKSVFAVLALAAAAAAQPTALTYQGRLKSAGQAASGLHDFRFRLFDAAQGGNQLGDTQCVNNITVSDGLFSAAIDFGQQFASPDGRFLEIQVREDTGLNCSNATGFVTLSPRQPLTPAPLATHANSAFALDAADGGPQKAVFVDDTGKVGIGTTTPAVPMHIANDLEAVLVLQDPGPADQQAGYIGFWNGVPQETGWMGFGTPGSPHMSIVNARPGGNLFMAAANQVGMTLNPNGRVGIGTTTPAARLDVRGDIRFGSGGELSPAAGAEDLRIVRGTIASDGSKIVGDGFTSQRTAQGTYVITFTTPFAQIPSITASADVSANEGFQVAMPDNVTTNKSDMHIFHFDLGHWDRAFHFIAVGPR